jgi:hypothetical protein
MAHNRKLPPLPPLDTLDPDDPRRWAHLFTARRLQKRMSYVRLATLVGISETSVIDACVTGNCRASTLHKLAVALDLTLVPPRVLTGYEAQHGR